MHDTSQLDKDSTECDALLDYLRRTGGAVRLPKPGELPEQGKRRNAFLGGSMSWQNA